MADHGKVARALLQDLEMCRDTADTLEEYEHQALQLILDALDGAGSCPVSTCRLSYPHIHASRLPVMDHAPQ